MPFVRRAMDESVLALRPAENLLKIQPDTQTCITIIIITIIIMRRWWRTFCLCRETKGTMKASSLMGCGGVRMFF